jgi:hypothetical protein
LIGKYFSKWNDVDFRFRNSDFGLKKLKSDYIPIKIPQSTIPNQQSNLHYSIDDIDPKTPKNTDFRYKYTVAGNEINH